MTSTADKSMTEASVKPTLSRSEQRKSNRQSGKGQKKHDNPSGEPSMGFFRRAYNFFVDAKMELTRVTWPTKKETIDTTWRLLVLVSLVGIYLWIVDTILSKLLFLLVG